MSGWRRGFGCAAGAALLASSAAAQWQVERLSQPRADLMGVAADDVAWFAGGRDASGYSAQVDVYDAASGTWSSAQLSQPRARGAAAAANGYVLFAGGETAGGGRSSRVDVLHVPSGTWSTAELSVPRSELAAAAAGDVLVFAGGALSSSASSAAVDLFDTRTATWSSASLSAARSAPVGVGYGARALVAGGFWSTAVETYDAHSGTWSASGWLSQTRGSSAAVLVDGLVLVAGGTDGGFVPSGVVDLYDVATDTWSWTLLATPRTGMAAASVGGRALFAGGWAGDSFAPSAEVELYDALTDEWSRLALPAPRVRLAAVGLTDRALFAGGVDASGAFVDSVYVHRPESPGLGYCFGDGSASPCPCGNEAGSARGCANSTGLGARLAAEGSASVAAGQLAFRAEGLVPQQGALLFCGRERVAGGAGIGFGDGLRCAGSQVARLEVVAADAAGFARYAPGSFPRPWSPGDTRRFQVWYRDPGTRSPCGGGFNLTNGVELLFEP